MRSVAPIGLTRPRWLLASLGLVLVLLSTVASRTAAQDRDLQAQREATQERLIQLETQIDREKTRLKKTQKQEQATQEKLEALEREIALREELVSTYQTRLEQLEQERTQLRDTLATLQARLDKLRADYRRRLVHAYKYGRLHDLALLLASRSINQMLVRGRYLQRFAADRREQRQAVQRATAEVRASREKIADTRAETKQLLAEARTERQNLRALKNDREQLIEKLRARESQIKKQLQQKQKQARQLQQRIQKLIARARANETEGETMNESSESTSPPPAAFANLSASFQKNRGELPWPADGAVTVDFGLQVDETYQTSTFHPGIRIATNPEAEVRVVFAGTVLGIDFVPGYGTYVVIRHGEYLSVYSNFSSLTVAEGDRVAAGQTIGRAGTDEEPLGASLFFGVVNQSTSDFVDPTTWLRTR